MITVTDHTSQISITPDHTSQRSITLAKQTSGHITISCWRRGVDLCDPNPVLVTHFITVNMDTVSNSLQLGHKINTLWFKKLSG